MTTTAPQTHAEPKLRYHDLILPLISVAFAVVVFFTSHMPLLPYVAGCSAFFALGLMLGSRSYQLLLAKAFAVMELQKRTNDKAITELERMVGIGEKQQARIAELEGKKKPLATPIARMH